MYVSVFQWLPYMRADRQIMRIFPNEYDRQRRFQKPATIPTREGSQSYDLRVVFPGDLKGKKKLVDEYLMVVGTRKPIEFRNTYSHEEFKSRLLETPLQDRRIVKKPYNVVRPE